MLKIAAFTVQIGLKTQRPISKTSTAKLSIRVKNRCSAFYIFSSEKRYSFLSGKRWEFRFPRCNLEKNFWRSKARQRRKSSVEMLVFPRIRKRLNLRLLLSTPNAPSTWMERFIRRSAPRSERRFSKAIFLCSADSVHIRISLFFTSSEDLKHLLLSSQPEQSLQR